MITITCPNCACEFTPQRLYRMQYADFEEVESIENKQTLYQISETYPWQVICYSCYTEFNLQSRADFIVDHNWGELKKK